MKSHFKPLVLLSLLIFAGLIGIAFTGYWPVNSPDLIIPGRFKQFTADQNGHIYTINRDHVIQKWDQTGKATHSINNKALGTINKLDVTNPLRLYLYYPEANIGLITDNTLSELNRIDWDRLGFEQALLTCRSTEQGFWLMDGNDMKLKRITNDGEVLTESNNLFAYTQKSLAPNHLAEYGNRVYLNNPNQGIMVFDRYATYVKTIRIKKIRTFDVGRNVLYYWKNGDLTRYDLKLDQKEHLNLPDTTLKNIQQVRFRSNRFLIRTNQQIKVYKKE